MATSAFDKIKTVLTMQAVLGPEEDADEIAGLIVTALELDDAAVPPHADPFASLRDDAQRLEEVMTNAGVAYQSVVEIAAGVKNNALHQGFDEPLAQQMGQMTFIKLIGLGQ